MLIVMMWEENEPYRVCQQGFVKLDQYRYGIPRPNENIYITNLIDKNDENHSFWKQMIKSRILITKPEFWTYCSGVFLFSRYVRIVGQVWPNPFETLCIEIKINIEIHSFKIKEWTLQRTTHSIRHCYNMALGSDRKKETEMEQQQHLSNACKVIILILYT